MSEYFSIRWVDGVVRMLDQRRLPDKVIYYDYLQCNDVALAIREMVIRGAPAIGVAAGYGLALVARYSKATNIGQFLEEIRASADELRSARPTAANLFSAIQRILSITDQARAMSLEQLRQQIVNEALKIGEEDTQMNLRIAQNGQEFIPAKAYLIHHCNTGALATAGIGTALGVIRLAHELGKKIHVFVDETRPRLQGARLTTWELGQLGIPHTLIVDGASGYIMKHYKIDACLVGCDRIGANGDVANKIGTYNLAIVARAHGVPFYSAGPITTLDLAVSSGDEIPIEQRKEEEVTWVGNTRIAPEGTRAANPAFDVTPAEYITAFITDRGVAYPPYEKSLAHLLNG
jgi:methylthioribose-1-phosphate isomerase